MEIIHSHRGANFATSFIPLECLRKASSELGEVSDPGCFLLHKSPQIQSLHHRLNLALN